MSWTSLTPKSVKARLSKQEHAHYIAASNNATDFDMLGEIIAQVTGLVRSKVAAWRPNLEGMGQGSTIPGECLHAAATIARSSLCAAFPVSEGETDLRKTELTNAHAYLDSVAQGTTTIAASDGSFPGADSVSFGGDRLMDFSQ